LDGDLIKDTFIFDDNYDLPLTLNFMEFIFSSPLFNIPEADGYLGLASNNQNYLPTKKNFLDQLVDQKLIKNKVFSIYVGGSDPHIKFGGWD
jgi:hypothetical protein